MAIPIDSITLAKIPYGTTRRMCELMPLRTLFKFRAVNKETESISAFRGEILEDLTVVSDKNNICWPGIPYSQLLSKKQSITPWDSLDVYMDDDINPEKVIQCMASQLYRYLWLRGNYHWKQVSSFFHSELHHVILIGNMELPEADMLEFFNALAASGIHRFSIHCHNANDTWKNVAFDAWHSQKGVLFHRVKILNSCGGVILAKCMNMDRSIMRLLIDPHAEFEDEASESDEEQSSEDTTDDEN